MAVEVACELNGGGCHRCLVKIFNAALPRCVVWRGTKASTLRSDRSRAGPDRMGRPSPSPCGRLPFDRADLLLEPGISTRLLQSAEYGKKVEHRTEAKSFVPVWRLGIPSSVWPIKSGVACTSAARRRRTLSSAIELRPSRPFHPGCTVWKKYHAWAEGQSMSVKIRIRAIVAPTLTGITLTALVGSRK